MVSSSLPTLMSVPIIILTIFSIKAFPFILKKMNSPFLEIEVEKISLTGDLDWQLDALNAEKSFSPTSF